MTKLPGYKRFVIGGIGGLAPVIVLLAAVDFERYFVHPDIVKVFGYAARAAILFSIGGLVAWLHETEHKLFKLFEIGLGAPALIAGLVTASSVAKTTPSISVPEHLASEQLSLSLISTAYAQETAPVLTQPPPPAPATPTIKRFSPPTQGAAARFLDGFLGIRPANIWNVIAGSYLDAEDAKKKAAIINSSNKGFKAEVYAPSEGKKYYAIVLGADLNRAEARSLRDRAIAAGLAEDTYIWTYPEFR